MFKMVSSPHTHSGKLTMRIMLWVILAMLPAMGVQLYYFGFGVLIQAALAISFALCLEGIVTVLRQKPTLFYLSDFRCDFNCADSCYGHSPLRPLLADSDWDILRGDLR
ncbi:RnfABCDGE type electron transport complex subunit D [Pasteurella multocida]